MISYRDICKIDKIVNILLAVVCAMCLCLMIEVLVSCGSSRKKIEKDLTFEYKFKNRESIEQRLDCLLSNIYIYNKVYVHEKDCTYVDSAGVVHHDRNINRVEQNDKNVEAYSNSSLTHDEKVVCGDSLTNIKQKKETKNSQASGFFQGIIVTLICLIVIVCICVIWYIRTKRRRQEQ